MLISSLSLFSLPRPPKKKTHTDTHTETDKKFQRARSPVMLISRFPELML